MNDGGVSEQNVSVTFDQPVILSDSQEPVDLSYVNYLVVIAVVAGGEEETNISMQYTLTTVINDPMRKDRL